MLDFDTFWRTLLPIFNDSYEFIYIILDLASIIGFFRIVFTLPVYLLGGNKRW